MYETFISNNQPISNNRSSLNGGSIQTENIELKRLFEECGGYSFRNGLYRVHTSETSMHWASIIGQYFPKYNIGKLRPFGYDWMGRQFSIELEKKDCIFMFDPSTGEDFELHESVLAFHNEDLVNELDNTLSKNTFLNVKKFLKREEILFNECCGYKIPLFLSGADAIENYEISDIEVYWQIQNQIYIQVKDLPPGTKINSVKIE